MPFSFPTVFWGATRAEFVPCERLPDASTPDFAPIRAAVAVVCFQKRLVLAKIAGRGWCTPSGRLEPGETWEEAARREAWEEAGAPLGELRLLGYFRLTDTETGKTQTVPTCVTEALALETRPPGFESLDVALFRLEDLPANYYTWDDLLEAVFRLAIETHQK